MNDSGGDLVTAQRAYQDAVERRRRVEEVKPAQLPGAEGGESSVMEAWRQRKASADAEVEVARRRLDAVAGTTHDGA